ncbi:MAG: pyrroline-5-carboxylate reductase [Candidatus Methanofastidiosia archaeon]
MLDEKILAVVGAGRIGESLISALLKAGMRKTQIKASAAHEKRTRYIEKKFGIKTYLNNKEMVKDAQIVLLSVKPQNVLEVLNEIKDVVSGKLIITIAAGVPISFLEEKLGREVPIVRGMPNTPVLVREGMTVLCSNRKASKKDLEIAREIFEAVGDVEILEERLMDAVTGLSGSGPAYIYVVIEALAEAGVKVGIPRNVATLLVAQTTLGSAKMVLKTKEHPAKLKDIVTTPAGCTIDGLLELEEGRLRNTLIKAVVKATDRSRELLEER